ncbi:ERO1-like protein beta [Diadema setosum]|uniref:ERO1-like protein beta n=1 Tax=Diadema setosum TaxID=31175 RepID=UPI003B3AE0EC
MSPYVSCVRKLRMWNILEVLCFILCLCHISCSTQSTPKNGDVHPCFCELNGLVDDCSCKVESVSEFNNLRLYPPLNSLLTRNYFKFFKVNLKRPCPFWADDSRCALKGCHVCPCSPDDLPCGLKDESTENKYGKDASRAGNKTPDSTEQQDGEETCDDEKEEEDRLGALDTTISRENLMAFETWREHDDAQLQFCEQEDEHSGDMEYVDLLLNPERYTGYKGSSPHRIWSSIYNENCFKPDIPDSHTSSYDKFLNNKTLKASRFLKDMCLEKRVFYRLVSGLHSSINIHLCAKYLLSEGMFGAEKWGPNLEEFQQRFDPETTDGEGPIRLKNLYFTYLVVLRAIAKAAPVLQEETFYTGEPVEDQEVQRIVKTILKIAVAFPEHFNESAMFQGDQQQALQLKEEFRAHFRNISRIMDCVGCDKCKLWGKLQIRGLGTALKILFTEQGGTGPSKLTLNRGEIVALFNGFGKLSSSISIVDDFQKLLSNGNRQPESIAAAGYL